MKLSPVLLLLPLLLVILPGVALSGSAATAQDATRVADAAGRLPADWLAAWKSPPARLRPLQIVHGIHPQRASPEGMRYYQGLGLGGIVCNVAFGEYLRSEANWKTLVAGVEACAELGLVVWIYDEDGYPSGAAGGLVLERSPAFEAQALTWDASRDPPFAVRPAYEHSHASNNFYAARRYPNLIDDRAMRCFIEVTHEAYWRRLAPHFGKTIQAMFTDEPSLIAINLGPLPDHVRKNVRVVDPLDPEIRALPSVPWSYDIADRYRDRYREELEPRRRSLFTGDTPEDRRTRQRYWSLVADLITDRYFGAIETWCRAHGVASSGHSLWEENLIHHPALEGNGLQVLARMDIPGLDLLNSDPEAVIHSGWLTAGLPASAALLTGRRRVMTEVSDFSQKLGGQGPVSLAAMQSVAGWQATWGVTDFTLYYGIGDRSGDDHRAYCDTVGRLNAILQPAERVPEVLLYYPIHDLWAEFRPQAGPVRMDSQTPRARAIVASFTRLGQTLQRSQVPFGLVDHGFLARGESLGGGRLRMGGQVFRALVVPEGAALPPDAQRVASAFEGSDGTVVRDGPGKQRLAREALVDALRPPFRLDPPSDRISLGVFRRDGRQVLALANVASAAYRGTLRMPPASRTWLALNPATGSVLEWKVDAGGRLSLQLAGRETVILVDAGARGTPSVTSPPRPVSPTEEDS